MPDDRIVWGINALMRVSRIRKMGFVRQGLWWKRLRRLYRYYNIDLSDGDLSRSANSLKAPEVNEGIGRDEKSDRWRQRKREAMKDELLLQECVLYIFMLSWTMWPHRRTVMRICAPHQTHTDLFAWMKCHSIFLFAVQVWMLALDECIYTT